MRKHSVKRVSVGWFCEEPRLFVWRFKRFTAAARDRSRAHGYTTGGSRPRLTYTSLEILHSTSELHCPSRNTLLYHLVVSFCLKTKQKSTTTNQRFRSMLIAEGHSNVQRIVVMMSGCTKKQYYRLPLLLTARPNLAECGGMRIASAATTRVESWRRSQLKSRATISKPCGALSPQSVWCLLRHD